MGVPKTDLAAASKAAGEDLAATIRKKVAGHAGGSVDHALALPGEARGARLSRLFELVTGDLAQRMARVLDIMDTLRRELPDILARLPLKLSHLGFTNLEALVQYLGEALFYMETGSATRTDFVRGIRGWRWNLVGRLLFERLVKFHPMLDGFFRALAADVVAVVNDLLTTRSRALVDVEGRTRTATATFGKPVKVLEFRMVGADGVERAFTDFGFLSRNAEGWLAIVPIEIKMPSALARWPSSSASSSPGSPKAASWSPSWSATACWYERRSTRRSCCSCAISRRRSWWHRSAAGPPGGSTDR
ncbi:MAG: hypothetical protein ABW156_09210 [Jiangellaceae bacterium]